MSKKFSELHDILYYECDITGKLSLPMLLNIVIKTSETQSDELGVGQKEIAEFGLAWVIVNYEIDIKRMPTVGERVQVSTEAVSYNKFFCYRNFWMHDANNQECVSIHSTFVLMDINKRKLSRVLEEIVAPYESEKTTKIARTPKMLSLQSGQMREYLVRFLDIDSNRHVNNSHYTEWMLDVLGYEFLTTYEPSGILLKYEKEVEYGNVIESHWQINQMESADELLTLHQITVADQLCAEANIHWRKISQ